MVREAEAAGFNPLTAIRNGGSAGFSVTNSTTPAVPLSARLADGVANATQTFFANFDPHADAMREKQYALIDAQVRNLNAQSGAIFPAMPGGFHSPGTYGGTYEGRASGKAGQLSGIAPTAPEAGDRTATNVFPAGTEWEANPYLVDAELWEQRYWEVGGAIGALVNGVGDHFWNTKLEVDRQRAKYSKKQAVNETRKERIRREAFRNANDLLMPPALR